MTKSYLISLAINFCLFHGIIQESEVNGLLEYMDILSLEDLLEEYLINVKQVKN
jgi:hypothetical protein